VARRFQRCDELRREALDPAHDRRVRQRQTALSHHFCEVLKAQLVTEMPTHAQDDPFAIKAATIEQPVNVFQLAQPLALVENSSVTDQCIRIAPQPSHGR
jgi:hypothetical protein